MSVEPIKTSSSLVELVGSENGKTSFIKMEFLGELNLLDVEL
jgi:hypothetical protein